MRTKEWRFCFFSAAVLLSVLFSACEKSVNKRPDMDFYNISFRNVPGVTQYEIKEIEALREQGISFIYGMPLSTEAFEKENGEIGGYTALLCEWLTELFGIPFQPRLYEWLDLLAGLESREVSFSGELTATPERHKIYHMTGDIASRPLKYYVLTNSRPLAEIAQERPIRCGFIEGTATINTVVSELKAGTFEIVLLSDVSLVYDALKSGTIDAFYYSGTAEANFVQYSDIAALHFYPLIFRPVSLTTQDSALAPIISVVQKTLEAGAMRYLITMYNQGEHEYHRYKLQRQLSKEERAYIQNRPIIPMGVDPGNYPGCFFDKREQEWHGVFLDMLDEVAFLTGLSFERVNDEHTEWPVIYRMLINGDIALVPELTRTTEREGQFLWPDTVHITDNYALISKYDFPDIKVNEILYVRVGLAKNTAYTAIFKKWFSNHMNTVEYESMEEAFDALQRGEVDMVMANQKRLLYLTHYLELPNYKANVVFDYAISVNFGLNKDEAVLCSIIDKALGIVDSKSISDNWMRRTYDYRSKVANAQIPWLIGSSVLTLFVLALVAILFVRSRRIGKRLERLVARRTQELELKSVTLSTLFDSIPDLIFTMDANLNFTQCNRSFIEHFGIQKENIIGKNEANSGLFPPNIAEEYIQWNRKIFEEGQTFFIEECIPRYDGIKPLYETVKAPLMLNGEVIGVLGIAHDITKRKKMEETALASSRSKSAFLANMSHEIRTPMNSIIGFSELAMDTETSEKTRDYLHKIQTNGHWLLQIINDILDISKIESGKMELEKIPFDMHDLFTSCRTLVMPKAVEKGILLHFYAEPSTDRRLIGDPTRLRQVFVNLLSNAIKFTNTGIVKLHAAIISKGENTVTMHFDVKDSGIGMTPEQIKKIFDPFMQAESGTTRKYGGTGLGLAITKNIVEMMGGTLAVESAVGVGSRFSFDLTLDTIDIADDVLREKDTVFNELEKPAFEGEILLCEDNAMNQQVICEHLSRVGLKTVVAENGKIGVEMVRSRMEKGEKQFDLIFMDMHMPVMDGLEASSKIMELTKEIPIVAMTANIMANDREIYRMSGMHDCVGKPFTSQELWHCLMKYFKPLNWQTENETSHTKIEDDLRHRLTTSFVKDNQNTMSGITQALNTGDIKLAHRLAHTLKSNAAHFGKMLLQKAAADVEHQLKNGQNTVTAQQLTALETELNAVLTEFTAELATKAETKEKDAARENEPLINEPETVDKELIKEVFAKLEPMLEMGSLECREQINSLRSIPGTHELIQQIDELDFEQAIVTLAELQKSL